MASKILKTKTNKPQETGKTVNTTPVKTDLKSALTADYANTKATAPASMNTTSSLGNPYTTTVGSNFQNKTVTADAGKNVSLPTGKTVTTPTTKASNVTGYLPTTVGSNFIGKGVDTNNGMNASFTPTGKAIASDLGKAVTNNSPIGKGVTTGTMNENPKPSILETVLDVLSLNSDADKFNNANSGNNAALNAAYALRNLEEEMPGFNGGLTGAVLQNYLNSQSKSAMTGENRTQNTARRIQNMNKYDTSEDYEGKVNGSERARNLIDQSPRTEAMSAWERLLSLINPDAVKGNTVGSQRTQGTNTGLADVLSGRYDTRSKGVSNDANANYGDNSYLGGNTSYGNGGSGGYSSRTSSTSRGLAGLGDIDISALYDLFNQRLNEYDNNYNSLMDALMEMYGANSANLEDSYAALLNALGLNYSDSAGLLRSQYENSQAELENSRRRQLQEAYISRMMQQKNLADQLDALGLTGGASETLLGSLLNNYANNRASVEEQIRTSLRDLLNNYMTNQSNTRQRYNESLINAQQRQLNARQDLLNNLYNAQTNALNTRANMRNNAYDDLFSTLANLAAKGYQI